MERSSSSGASRKRKESSLALSASGENVEKEKDIPASNGNKRKLANSGKRKSKKEEEEPEVVNNNHQNSKEEEEQNNNNNGSHTEDKTSSPSKNGEVGQSASRPARVYVDGIFDLFHYGHALALKQAKILFPYTHLLVGVCNDELTHKLKGLTVMTHAERAESLRHCRYVDEVVENAPWIVNQEFMDLHKIDFMAHGQDPVLDKEGNDIYQFAKDSGKFLYINRTDGISTSDLILRIIKEYDSYVARNIARGYSRKDLNVSLVKEKQIVMKQKLKKLKDDFKEGMEDNHIYEFIKKFGDYLKQNWEGEKFPC